MRPHVIKIAGLALAALTLPVSLHPLPRLVWNATASAPMGLYWVAHAHARRGDLALVPVPAHVRDLADSRHYIPYGVPLVKAIAAVSGDEICAEGGTISVNGEVVAHRLAQDSQGRAMPSWDGCHVLNDEVLPLMTDVSSSFDGRYFGPVRAASVIGVLTPLFIASK